MVKRDEAAPLVAVVTPVRNGEAHLAETMEAVQAQDYPNLLHVILDNASTDETPAIIRAYGQGPVPLSVWRNREPLRRAANWETAIHQIPADAGYFRLLFAGDRIRPDAIGTLVTVAERSRNVGAVGSLIAGPAGAVPDYRLLPADRSVFSGHDIATGLFRDEVYPVWTRHLLVRASLLHHRAPYFAQNVDHPDLDSFFALMCVSDFGFVHEVLGWDRGLTDGPRPDVYDRPLVAEWMMALNRYGPTCFMPEEFGRVSERFYRGYQNALLHWRLFGRLDDETYNQHLGALSERGRSPTLGRRMAVIAGGLPRAIRVGRSRTGARKPLRLGRSGGQTGPAGAPT